MFKTLNQNLFMQHLCHEIASFKTKTKTKSWREQLIAKAGWVGMPLDKNVLVLLSAYSYTGQQKQAEAEAAVKHFYY